MLPSEAEWEKAARGRHANDFPWGNEWQDDHANTSEMEFGETSSVGLFQKGKSPYGCEDMAGNVWEWTRSRWNSDDGERENLSGDDFRVLRGGSWLNSLRNSHCAVRNRVHPAYFYNDRGFRLVLTLADF